MTQPPTPLSSLSYQSPSFTVDRDSEHLKILSLCWYVMAALTALFGFFPLIYTVLGIVMVFNPSLFKPDPPAPLVAWLIAAFAACFTLGFWILALLSVVTGRSLRARHRKNLIYVTAAIACLWIPFGTVLGVFTFIVLARSSVSPLFSPPGPT